TWFSELAQGVETGQLHIPRAVLPRATSSEVSTWLERNLSDGVARPDIGSALGQDILGLMARLGAMTGAERFMLRIFTEAPSTECGFHVDTVPPAAPILGLLRVYNGAGTCYVDPRNVTSMKDFYRYLGKRERL